MNRFEGLTEISFKVNGVIRRAVCRPGETLLHVLRENLGLTGPKIGCENGDCGACTVLLNGEPVKACLILSVEAEGQEITTVEGLKDSIAAQAFRQEGAFQCGYCTAGFIVNTQAMIDSGRSLSEKEISRWLNSNLCRCTGYESIQKAARAAADGLLTSISGGGKEIV